MNKKWIIGICFMICLFSGCEGKKQNNMIAIEKANNQDDLRLEESEAYQDEESSIKTPNREEVLIKRKTVLEGMKDDEITQMTECIKAINLALENSYMYDNIFEKLENPKDLHWNYVDYLGEIQIGWAFKEGIIYNEDNDNLTEEEFNKKYGEPVWVENKCNAETFITKMEKLSKSTNSESLKQDFADLIYYMESAKETHDVEWIEKIYQTVHDMDYFLLRYGLEDVGKYTNDKSTVSLYYGTLNEYK